MRVVFTRGARRQVETTVDDLARHSPQGAMRVRARIKAVTDLLEKHPRAGRATELEGVRRMPVHPFPYLVFYRIVKQTVVVQFVRHTSRDPSGSLDD